jgi:ABC-type multidrug transport system fused ATPase/permease subunit
VKEYIKIISFLLNKDEIKKGYLVLVLALIVSIVDVLGVASIFPFISLIADPDIIKRNKILFYLYDYFYFKNTQQFTIYFGILIFAYILISLVLRSYLVYIQTRYSYMREFSISKRLFVGYLNQPYVWFSSRNSSELSKNILVETQNIVTGSIMPLFTVFSQSFIIFSLGVLIIIIEYKLAIILFIFFTFLFLVFKNKLSKKLRNLGEKRNIQNSLKFKAVNEAFGGIKDLKLKSLQSFYTEPYSKSAFLVSEYQSKAQSLTQTPKFILEGFGMGTLILVLLYFLIIDKNLNYILPLVSLYAFVAYRIIPAIQQVYGNYTLIKYNHPALLLIFNELKNFISKNENRSVFTEIDLNKSIELRNISFRYPNTSKYSLNNINLIIEPRKSYAIVGSTGSGKTTLIDTMLGLLVPQEGEILIGDKFLDSSNIGFFQTKIGYVPQNIYILDDSIISNIALGVNIHDIDISRVIIAAKVAKIHDFIVNELEEGYDTVLGERGVKLSGGERQRIGIARAIYHNPTLLILDEGTSALDNITESEVSASISELSDEMTIILIAHRLSTITNCDKIFFLDEGKLIDSGTYEELSERCLMFKSMITAGLNNTYRP